MNIQVILRLKLFMYTRVLLSNIYKRHRHGYENGLRTTACVLSGLYMSTDSMTKGKYTVEPPNKGHFGDNINSAVVSFVDLAREVVLSSEVQNVLEL